MQDVMVCLQLKPFSRAIIPKLYFHRFVQLLQEWHRMIQQITGSGNDDERERNKEQIKKSLGNTIEIKDAMVIDD